MGDVGRSVRIGDKLGDLVPVHRDVQPHTDPPAVPDVGRHEESFAVRGNQRLLHAGWRRRPERESVIVVVIGVRHECLLVAHEPRRLAVAESFGRLRQRKTQITQRLQRILAMPRLPPIGDSSASIHRCGDRLFTKPEASSCPKAAGKIVQTPKAPLFPALANVTLQNVSVGHTGHLLGSRVQFLSQMLLIEVNAPAFRR